MKKHYSSLIIGGDSFLGKELFDSLSIAEQSTFYTTRQLNRKRNSIFLNLVNLKDFKLPSGINRIFLCAAETDIGKCEKLPNETSEVNVNAVTKLISICNKFKIKLIFPSSNLVFSGKKGPLFPDSTLAPVSEYGRQKVLAEKKIRKYCDSFSIVRFGKILTKSNSIFKNWKEVLISGGKIQAFSDLYIAPVTLKQAGKVMVKSSEHQENSIFHFSAIDQISYYEAALLLAEFLEISPRRLKPVSGLSKIKHIQEISNLNSSYTFKTLGIEPITARDALKDFFITL